MGTFCDRKILDQLSLASFKTMTCIVEQTENDRDFFLP